MEIAVLQCCSPSDPKNAKDYVLDLLQDLSNPSQKKVDGVFLPEVVNMVAKSFKNAYSMNDDPFIKAMQDFSRKNGLWINVGSVIVKENDTLKNRCIFINDGKILAFYDKLHLFDVNLPEEKITYRESRNFSAGNEAVLLNHKKFKMGLSICYDLRQPKLFRDLSQKGAEIISVPSAFTYSTGKMHWHTLLRARAIENGVFIVASAQAGTHEDGRRTFGHSLVVDPFGNIIAEAEKDYPQLLRVSLNLSEVKRARQMIPALTAEKNYQFKQVQI